ncbi:MAG: DUF2834 domain-containing protein [Rhodobacteraceae bacterium]|nr:DUF2834 domain-containing protein [Paracoccaceae bacterium]
MTYPRLTYLTLAVIGTVWPMYYFVSWFVKNGWSLMAMVDAWHANTATSGLVWDLTIAAITLTIWILTESIPRRDWRSLLSVPAIYCIGVSCGLPLYLFLRSRPRRR